MAQLGRRRIAELKGEILGEKKEKT